MDGKEIVAEMLALVDAAIEEARVEEREAIAKLVADELSLFSCTCCQRVLKAIRARRTP